MEMEIEKIAILDCGGQYTKVIDRKVREMAVKSEIFPLGVTAAELAGFRGIILSGGPNSVWESGQALHYKAEIFELGIPVLGICYGMQLLNQHFGGVVAPGVKTEYGDTVITLDSECLLFDGLNAEQRVLMSHGDSVAQLAPGFKVAGHSGEVVAAFYHEAKKVYGVQFHPEVDLTEHGREILGNFLFKIAGLTGNYVLEDRINMAIAKIKEQVGEEKVLVLVSGGVDSAVTAALLLKALNPENVYAIHIDHGLMRKNESDLVCENLKQMGLKHLIRENAAEFFFNTVIEINGEKLGPLTSLVDPETKRHLIGEVFIRVIQKTATSLNLNFDKTIWAQGTLRPDLIESGNPDVSGHAHRIKTHHNDVDIVRRAREKGLVVETNWDWHKDEVRQVARALGIEESVASRQPFPGPGLAIRLLCNDGKDQLTQETLTKFETVMTKLISETGVKCQGSIVPLKSVGVQGDCRSYRYLSILAGEGLNFDWEKVYHLGRSLPNQVDFVNRVAYVLNQQQLSGSLQTYPMYINEANVNLLREIDHLVVAKLNYKPISQVFAVLLPLGITKKYSVAIRTFVTNDFMTGRPAYFDTDIRREILAELVQEIEIKFPEIDLILYDVTSKPPATVEWQ